MGTRLEELIAAISEALVLGGGGVAGIAWMAGLADAGQNVTGVALVIGGFAGATDRSRHG